MGNQLIKDTHIEKEPIGKTGIGLQWEMYSGHKLDKSKTPATIFLFDKKELLKASSSVREEALALIKKEPQSLARFKHPNILSLLDPLLEDPKSMGFVTEATKGSLHNFIQSNRASEIFPTEIDTKFHILELAETLSFLHNDVKSCHLAICPENVYVLNDEKWKLGGFTFVTQITQGSSADTNINFTKNLNIRPSLNFCAPEVANSNSKCSFASDIFSLGCLIYTLYKINQDKSTKNPYLMNVGSVNEVQDFAKNMHKQNFTCIPNEIRQFIVRMLSPEPSMRPTISELVNHQWFKDPFIQTVKHLETLYQRELAQQQSFLKGLNQIVLRFEKKFVISKILPLLNDLIKNEKLAASIIPIYFSLVEGEGSAILTKQEFHNVVWPSIKALTTGKGIPAQALYLLIQNSQILVEIGDMKEIQTIFVPLLTKAFECGVAKLQILALKKTEALFSKMEYNVSKSQLLPRILNMCVDANIDIRKEAIILLSKIYQIFDKTTINDQVLNTLEKVRKMNNNYKINMTLLQIFEGISKNIGVETIANKILVSMIPMLVDQSLSKTEYKAYLSTVNAYLKRIEEEQNKYYEGKPDLPQEEVNDNNLLKFEPSKPTRKVDGTEFNFLDAFTGGSTGGVGGSSSTGIPANSGGGWGGGIDDFDFTSFDEQFKSSSNTNNAGNFGNSPLSPSYNASSPGLQTVPKKTTNIDAFNFTGQQAKVENPSFPKPTPVSSQPQKTLASLNIKKPSNAAGTQQQQSGGFNFGQQPSGNFQSQSQNQQSNFNFTPAPTTGSNKWDILDNELGSAGLSSNQGFGASNNFNMMSSSSNNNNQFQFNSNPPSYNPQPASQGWNSQQNTGGMFQGMNMNNKNSKPSSDDFFDSFNVPSTNQKKNAPFNINTNNWNNNNNNNDLL